MDIVGFVAKYLFSLGWTILGPFGSILDYLLLFRISFRRYAYGGDQRGIHHLPKISCGYRHARGYSHTNLRNRYLDSIVGIKTEGMRTPGYIWESPIPSFSLVVRHPWSTWSVHLGYFGTIDFFRHLGLLVGGQYTSSFITVLFGVLRL